VVAKNQNSHRWPHFLPDNRHFIFWARNAQGAAEQAIYLGSLDSREIKKIAIPCNETPFLWGFRYMLWLPLQTGSPIREVIADGNVSATRRIYAFRGIGGRSAKARQAQPCGAGFPHWRGPALL
jgi:hypothetical protein